jgi:hypothetical protein
MLERADAGARRIIPFAEAIDLAPNVSRLVGRAPMEGRVRGIDATPYDTSRFCGTDFLLVGDAASFLDPLSAHGVHKAMDGALLAAIAVHTILERPESACDAAEFYNQRESSIYKIATERLRSLYWQENRFRSSSFWRRRSELRRRSAFGRNLLPQDQVLKVRGPSPRPVVEGEFIARREVLVASGQERPVRFLGPVCLPDLYKDVVSTGSALEAARRSPAGLERALAAVDWLYRSGYLEPRDPPEI